MSLLSDLKSLISSLGIPVETGVFTDNAPNEYAVLTPMNDIYDIHADNQPGVDIQSVRISLYSKGNYSQLKRRVVSALLNAELTITARLYVGYEYDTKYHHFAIDVENFYDLEE